jgi:hypothetical protein
LLAVEPWLAGSTGLTGRARRTGRACDAGSTGRTVVALEPRIIEQE